MDRAGLVRGTASGLSGRLSALKPVVRVLVGAGVFAFLLLRSDVGELWGTIRAARPAYVVGALAAVLIGLLVSALRWRAYLDALGFSLGYGTLFRLSFVGIFFNAFLPTGVGGDAYKAVRLGRARGTADEQPSGLAPAVASVFLDRFAGAVAVAALGLTAALVLLASGNDSSLPVTALVLSIGVLAAGGILLWRGERLLGKGRFVPDRGFGADIRRAVRAIHEAARHPRAATRGYLLSLAVQGFVLLAHLMIVRALGISVSTAALACIMVVALHMSLIPLTINGLGFREGAYVWGFGILGVDHDPAFAFGLLILVVVLIASGIGGIIYVTRGGEVSGRE